MCWHCKNVSFVSFFLFLVWEPISEAYHYDFSLLKYFWHPRWSLMCTHIVSYHPKETNFMLSSFYFSKKYNSGPSLTKAYFKYRFPSIITGEIQFDPRILNTPLIFHFYILHTLYKHIFSWYLLVFYPFHCPEVDPTKLFSS